VYFLSPEHAFPTANYAVHKITIIGHSAGGGLAGLPLTSAPATLSNIPAFVIK